MVVRLRWPRQLLFLIMLDDVILYSKVAGFFDELKCSFRNTSSLLLMSLIHVVQVELVAQCYEINDSLLFFMSLYSCWRCSVVNCFAYTLHTTTQFVHSRVVFSGAGTVCHESVKSRALLWTDSTKHILWADRSNGWCRIICPFGQYSALDHKHLLIFWFVFSFKPTKLCVWQNYCTLRAWYSFDSLDIKTLSLTRFLIQLFS